MNSATVQGSHETPKEPQRLLAESSKGVAVNEWKDKANKLGAADVQASVTKAARSSDTMSNSRLNGD